MLSIDEGTTTSSKQLAEVMSTSSAGPPDSLRIKVYTRRWFMLLIFILFSSTNFVQGVHYALIENIMTRYYNVSALAIESTAFVPNAMYVLGCVPISFMVYVLDLRNSCMIAAVVSCIATWMKVYAVSPDRFALALIAQAIMGLCQIVILTTPVSLAAYWFGPNEVATATAVGSLGMVMGMAVFSLILPMVVHNHESIEEIGRDNYYFTLGVAIVSTVSVFLVVTFFRNEPCLPPSQSRALQKLKKKEEFHFVQPLLRVIKDKNYLLLWNAHGFIMGTASSIGTLFNRLFLLHFENSEMDVGKLSMVAVSSGIAGGIIVGIIQDKKKIFKSLLIILSICMTLGQISFGIALYMNVKWATFVAAAISGFFMLAYTASSFETCVEIMYPESEQIPIAVLNSAAQLYAIVFLVLSDKILTSFDDWVVQAFFTGILFAGFLCQLGMKDIQNRQAAMKSTNI